MKRMFVFIIFLACVLVLNGCAGITPVVPSSTTAGVGSTTGGEVPTLKKPAFAEDAFLWEATAEAGKTEIDSKYHIIIQEGNSSASTSAQVLRLGLSNVIGSSLRTTNDKLDNNPERDKEILLGTVNNRSAASAVFEKHAEVLSSYTDGIGVFYIGADNGKILILAEDDDSMVAATAFFVQQYVREKEVVEIESDLASIYFYDKIEYANSREIVCVSQEDLMNNALMLNLKLDGRAVEGFSSEVDSYNYDIQRSDSIPVISADVFSPYATVNIEQPSASNNWTGKVTVASADESTSKVYTVKINRAEYDLVGATLHKLKNGATGAISLVQDDGFNETTEIMLEVCKQYGLKFNIAMAGKKVGELQQVNGQYVFDENGNYKTTILSGASWWQNIVSQNSDVIEITSHSLTHASWGLTDEVVKAEIIGSQQILRDAFPGQRVLTFAYPGFTSSTRDAEYAKAREFMAGHYIAARYLSTGKHNSLSNPTYLNLDCCSLYYNDPATWGTGANNNDGWMMKAIQESCSNGGWIVTMNHMIASTNSGLTNNSMTIDRAMFEHVVVDYIVPNVQKGLLWNGFFSEVAQYVTEYNSANLVCKTYEDGVILIDLTDEEDDTLYDYALTIDVPVDETWTKATLTYTGRDGGAVEKVLSVSTASDGSRYIRIELVPDCGTATLAKAN